MKLLLIRHGETEHNVQSLLAGVTDSRLTNHGVLQTQRLGSYLAKHQQRDLTHIFASDLSRARDTAQAIANAQEAKWSASPSTWKLDVHTTPLLREQDFGSLECTPWAARHDVLTYQGRRIAQPGDADFVSVETHDAMAGRASRFWSEHLLPLLTTASTITSAPLSIAIVSHGMFLSTLWPEILSHFGPQSILLGPEVSPDTHGRPLAYLPGWSNTGVLELDLFPPRPPTSTDSIDPAETEVDAGAAVLAEPLAHGFDEHPGAPGSDAKVLRGWKMVILRINGREHLRDLRRTGGGLGSAAHDSKQKKVDSFFKKAA